MKVRFQFRKSDLDVQFYFFQSNNNLILSFVIYDLKNPSDLQTARAGRSVHPAHSSIIKSQLVAERLSCWATDNAVSHGGRQPVKRGCTTAWFKSGSVGSTDNHRWSGDLTCLTLSDVTLPLSHDSFVFCGYFWLSKVYSMLCGLVTKMRFLEPP